MQFTIQRETFLVPLQRVIGVIERRQTLAVLANFLLEVEGDTLTISGTDLEVEMIASVQVDAHSDGRITVPARKLFDIVRALADGMSITVKLNADGNKVQLEAGKSRFTLATLPADDFPLTDAIEVVDTVSIEARTLKTLLDRTSFAMASQDVRFYLNGLLLELEENALRCVATDGHRMALAQAHTDQHAASKRQVIVPRKGVSELLGLFDDEDSVIELKLAQNHIQLRRDNVCFTSKLIDGKFPDYQAVIPLGVDKIVSISRQTLRMALQRVAILSNEKFRGVKLEINPGQIRVQAHNPEQEEAIEEVEATTDVSDLSVGFNVGYLLDALGALPFDTVKLKLRDGQSSCLIEGENDDSVRHVIMPLRL